MKQKSSALSALALAVLAVAACGSAPSAPAQVSGGGSAAALGGQDAANALNALYSKAQQGGETQVVVYSPDAPSLQGVYNAFSKRFPGITVSAQLLTGTQLNTRIDEEFLTGKHTADVLDLPGDGIWRAYTRNQLTSYTPATQAGLKDKYEVIGPKDTWTTPYVKLNGILYNTSLVSKSEAPKSYSALLQARWKGKVVITDPRQIGASSGLLIELVTEHLVPSDYLQRFRDQNPILVPHAPQVAQAVASGQAPLSIPYGVQTIVQDRRKGAPEGLVLPPTEGAEISHTSVGVVNGAPHPSAAKLLEAWMLTPEGQKALATDGFYGTMPGSPPPSGFPKLSTVKVIPEPSPADYDQVLNAGIANLGRLWGA